ncbi:MAG: helix-turn-helix domain-containing protein [Anaerolineales bacterium]
MNPDLVFHPVRMRIITAVSGRQVTTRQLLEAIPEIPQATLYRHVRALIKGGVLEVVEARKIRGVEERIFKMKAPPSVTRRDLKGKTNAELEQMGMVFVSGLLSDIRRYLQEKKTADPFRDGVQLNKVTLFLSDTELAKLNGEVMRLIRTAVRKEPAPGRKGRIFSYTIIPSE